MAIDPATFVVADCTKGQTVQQGLQAELNILPSNVNSFESLARGNGINNTGFGPVGNGLNLLAQVSNSIRIGQATTGLAGQGSYNSTLSAINATPAVMTDAGANVVLNTAGISSNAVSVVGATNPVVAANAVNAAKSVFTQVKNGTFSATQIPAVFSDINTLGNLAASTISLIDPSFPSQQQIVMCQASPFAVDLIAHAPKFKFMFVIQFLFNPPYTQIFDGYGAGTAFVVKTSTRPAVEFEHEEINMYNFRTRVPKRTMYAPMTMSFYDDNTNNVTNFYNTYLKSLSPIANQGGEVDIIGGLVGALTTPQPNNYQVQGMNDPLNTFNSSSASLGPLQNNQYTMLNAIRLYHIFDYGAFLTVYNFFNPKILAMRPDELNMADSGGGSEMQFEFAYDGLFIVPAFNVQTGTGLPSLRDLTSGGLYPIIPTFAPATGSSLGSALTNIATGALSAASGALTAAESALGISSGPVAAASVAGSTPVSSGASQAQSAVQAAAATAAAQLPTTGGP